MTTKHLYYTVYYVFFWVFHEDAFDIIFFNIWNEITEIINCKELLGCFTSIETSLQSQFSSVGFYCGLYSFALSLVKQTVYRLQSGCIASRAGTSEPVLNRESKLV